MLRNPFSRRVEETSVTSNGALPADRTWLEAPRWNKNFVPFGDRLDFLSAEKQHLNTGHLRILPPRGERKRYGDV